MSAYIVEDETICTFVNFLIYEHNPEYNSARWLLNRVKARSGFDLTKESHVEAFVQACGAMNRRAVNSRYREKEPVKAVKFKRVVSVITLVQAIKSLECFLYQCCEGTEDETELYKLLEYIDYQWLGHAVRRLPAWEKSTWR